MIIYFNNEITEKDLIDYGFDHRFMQFKIQNQIEYIIVTDPPPNNIANIFDSNLAPFFQTLHPHVFTSAEWKITQFRGERKFVFIVWK